jgi:hypothetical protein
LATHALFAGVDELDAVALIFERVRQIKRHPAAVFALVFIGRRCAFILKRADVRNVRRVRVRRNIKRTSESALVGR